MQHEIELRSDMTVRLVRAMGDDKSIVEDARTSLRAPGKSRADSGSRELNERDRILLREFFSLGHASTMRGCALTVELEVPLFVQRELRTHWVANRQTWSDFEENDILGWNDQSGRYRKYEPVFWVPRYDRVMIEPGQFDPMKPVLELPERDQRRYFDECLSSHYGLAWSMYQNLLEANVAREVARAVLPQAIYVAGRMTMNLNAAFGLMALRIDHPDNARQTYPQREIQEVAEEIEAIVAKRWPEAHKAWTETGRIRP